MKHIENKLIIALGRLMLCFELIYYILQEICSFILNMLAKRYYSKPHSVITI